MPTMSTRPPGPEVLPSWKTGMAVTSAPSLAYRSTGTTDGAIDRPVPSSVTRKSSPER